MSSPAQPFINMRDKLASAGRSFANGNLVDALREMLGMNQSAPQSAPQQMNWTPEANPQQLQEIQREQPMRKAMKDAVRK